MGEPGRGVWERGDVVAWVLGVVDHAFEADVGVVGGVSVGSLVLAIGYSIPRDVVVYGHESQV